MGLTCANAMRALLATLLAVSSCLAFAAPAPPQPSAAAFDQVFQRIIGPASMDADIRTYYADLESLRGLVPPGDTAREVKFRSVYCGSERWENPRQGLAYSDEAVRRARAIGDLASEARAGLCRMDYTMALEGSRKGLPIADAIIERLRGSKERQLLGEILLARGSVLSELGDLAKAMLDFQRARAAFVSAGIDHDVDALLLQMAIAYRRIGDWPQAEQYFSRSLDRMKSRRDWDMVSTDLIQLGFLYDESGDAEKAESTFTQAVEVAAAHDLVGSASAARIGLAAVQARKQESDAALRTLALARASLQADHDDSYDDMLLLVEGQARAAQGRHETALELYRRALPLIERNGNERYEAMLYRAQATSLEALGRSADALAAFKRYADLQASLQGKMRLEQSRLLQYEYEIRRRDFENRSLRAEAAARQQQVDSLQRVRHLQALSLLLGALLIALLTLLAWRQWRKSRSLRAMAMTDPLTEVASRRAIEALADRELSHAITHHRPLSVLMLDLDFFKSINDRYGHAIGDVALRTAAAVWREQLRSHDLLGRIGGEEFVALCPETSHEHALAVAARLLQATRDLRVPDTDPPLTLSVSIGIAEATQEDTRESLFARADAALYRAKRDGRDNVAS